MSSSVLVYLLGCLLVGHVQAHGHIFQPALEPPVEKSLRSNATTIEKRWVGVEHGYETYSTKLWPKGNIEYAFKTKELEEQWGGFIDLGVIMWHGAGLVTEDDKDAKDDKDDKDDMDKLTFAWNQVSVDACTSGKYLHGSVTQLCLQPDLLSPR